MRTVTIYKFDELSDEAKRNVFNWYKDNISLGCEDYIKDVFKPRVREICNAISPELNVTLVINQYDTICSVKSDERLNDSRFYIKIKDANDIIGDWQNKIKDLEYPGYFIYYFKKAVDNCTPRWPLKVMLYNYYNLLRERAYGWYMMMLTDFDYFLNRCQDQQSDDFPGPNEIFKDVEFKEDGTIFE